MGCSNLKKITEPKNAKNLENARKIRRDNVQAFVDRKEEVIYQLIRIYSIEGGIRHQKLADLVELD